MNAMVDQLLRNLISRMGGIYPHWKLLYSLARRQTKTTISAWMSSGGVQPTEQAKWPQLSYYVCLVFASLVLSLQFLDIGGEFNNDLLQSTTNFFSLMVVMLVFYLANTYVPVYVSDEDYDNLSYRPVDTHTYYLAKISATLTTVLVSSLVVVSCSVISLTVSGKWLIAIALCIVTLALNTSITVAIVGIYAYITRRAIQSYKNPKLLLLSSCLLCMVVGVPFLGTIYLHGNIEGWIALINPVVWFASIVAVTDGVFNPTLAIGITLASILSSYTVFQLVSFGKLEVCPTLPLRTKSKRLSAKNLRTKRIAQSSVRVARPTFQSVMLSLYWSHVKFDKKCRAFTFSKTFFIILTCAYWVYFLITGASENIGKTPILVMLYFVTLMGPWILSTVFEVSSQYRASWVLLCAPVSVGSLVGFGQKIARRWTFPSLLLLCIVALFAYGMEETVLGLLRHGVLLCGFAYLMLQLQFMGDASVPFSRLPSVNSNYVRLLLWSFGTLALASLLAFVLPMLAAQGIWFIGSVIVVGALNVGVHLWTRKRNRRTELHIEFVV